VSHGPFLQPSHIFKHELWDCSHQFHRMLCEFKHFVAGDYVCVWGGGGIYHTRKRTLGPVCVIVCQPWSHKLPFLSTLHCLTCCDQVPVPCVLRGVRGHRQTGCAPGHLCCREHSVSRAHGPHGSALLFCVLVLVTVCLTWLVRHCSVHLGGWVERCLTPQHPPIHPHPRALPLHALPLHPHPLPLQAPLSPRAFPQPRLGLFLYFPSKPTLFPRQGHPH
jgi:hypothetical protein